MRIGLISDTHGLLRPEVLTHFAGVACILHAGDIGNPDILTDLALLAPVRAVFGNTDVLALRTVAPAQVELELEGWRIVVTHGHELGSPTPAKLQRAYPAADILVYGHTHRPLAEEVAGVLVVNPGAAGPARFDTRPSVALLDLAPGARQVEFIAL